MFCLQNFNQNILFSGIRSVDLKVQSPCWINLFVEGPNIEVVTILGARACPILAEGGKEEGELRWYSASGHQFVFTCTFNNPAWSKRVIVCSIYHKESVYISSIANSNPRIIIDPCPGRIEPDCDSDGDVCIQLPCSSNGNFQQLLTTASRPQSNETAVNCGAGSNEVCKVADVFWSYEDTLQLCAAS